MIAAGATEILLDNMAVEEMVQVVAELGDRATFEASGGLTLEDAEEVARTGVDFVAVVQLLTPRKFSILPLT